MEPKSPSTHKVSPPSQIPIVSLWLSCSPRVTLLWSRYYKSLISFKFIENIPKIPKFLKSLNFSNSILRIPNPLIFLNISNSIPSIPKFLNSLTNQFEQFSNQFPIKKHQGNQTLTKRNINQFSWMPQLTDSIKVFQRKINNLPELLSKWHRSKGRIGDDLKNRHEMS